MFEDDVAFDLEAMSFLDRMHVLQNGLVTEATGGSFDRGDDVYRRLRQELIAHKDLSSKVPAFVLRCRDTSQFWQYIKHEFGTYAERRKFIWDSFGPLLDHLEVADHSPAANPIGEKLGALDSDNVHRIWQKALDRRTDDPEGAITAARTLLESVLKHILDDADIKYRDVDLPKLWELSGWRTKNRDYLKMDRPALETEDEIEVTPEMVEAGAEELRANLGGGIIIDWNPHDLASLVFRAMDAERHVRN